MATTENWAGLEAQVPKLAGCVPMVTARLITRVALFEVTDPQGALPVITTLKFVAASAVVTLLNVKVAVVAPDIFPALIRLVVPFLHW